MRGYAYYSPLVDAPPGGLCLSSFALLRRGDAFLAVKPKPHDAWKDWAPNWDVYDAKTLENQFHLWRLPSSYLREGEAPEDTARRIVQEQLGAERAFVRSARTLSFHDPSGRFPGQKHWDLCFVFEVDAEPAPLARLPWLAESRWVKPQELHGEDFGSAIGDLARALGLARGSTP